MLFYPLYYDTISLKITQVFHLLLDFAENQIVFWDLKIQNSVRITGVSDNGDLDNQGPTELMIYALKIKHDKQKLMCRSDTCNRPNYITKTEQLV